jgi:hypothetical protein
MLIQRQYRLPVKLEFEFSNFKSLSHASKVGYPIKVEARTQATCG